MIFKVELCVSKERGFYFALIDDTIAMVMRETDCTSALLGIALLGIADVYFHSAKTFALNYNVM